MAFNTSLVDLKKYVRLSNSNDVSVILGKEPLIIQKYLSGIFGMALITEIGTWSNATGTKLQIYNYTCNILAKLCVLSYIPENEVQISDAGLIRTESPTAKTAYSGQVDRLKMALEEDSFMLIDLIIETFFSDNTISTLWEDSPVYLSSQNSVFKTAKQFSKIVQLNRPYQAFIALETLIKTWTLKSLNKRFNSDVVTTVLAASTNPNVLLFLDNIRAAIAYRTIYEASFMNLVQFDSTGVKFISSVNDVSAKSEMVPDTEQFSAQQRQFRKNYEMHLAECDSLVKNNPTDFGTTPPPESVPSDTPFYA